MGWSGPNPYAKPAPTVTAPAPPFRWETAPVTVSAAGEGRIEVRLVVPTGTEVFRDQLEVSVLDAGGLQIGEPDLPPASSIHADQVSGRAAREFYDRDVIVWLDVKAPPGLAGVVRVSVKLGYQGCQGRLCWPPKTVERKVTVTVEP